ncbi:MAG: thioredoxin domain-containing protein [Leptospira sp.]|uniref:thioredoxin domain-containing protein n=1 Tax=Leptospira sp. TaxID=178 RepID=UPI0025BDCE82|nr:thioredoxin domain-containing protein [Leptospira sp.]MBL0956397.1 thioredoxin domain-containing protein [Leptospira sp.]
MNVPIVILFYFFFSCSEPLPENRYLPESLPSEESIKETLSSEIHLNQLNEKAKSLGITLHEWKETERKLVSETDINHYWGSEKKQLRSSIQDTDAIDRLREMIRIRIVWSRIFQKSNISIKQKSITQSKISLLSKINSKFSPQFGQPNSKWVIVEWSDYICGFCKETFPHTQKLLSKYKNQIHYIHKDFPLDGDTNQSLAPLVVSRCLWDKDPVHFTEHMQNLYANAKTMIKTEIPIPNQSSVWSECDSQRETQKYLDLVKKDWEEAKKLGVTSIPTFWVNGKWIVGALNQDTWERVLKDTSP